MALKSLSFITISALLVASTSMFSVSTAFDGRKALPPGADPVALPPGVGVDFIPLNTNDPKVIDLAKYAIDEYNEINSSKLAFTAVYEALYTGDENGTNYGLVVAATNDGNELNYYVVNIWVGKDEKKLTAFRQSE